MTGTVELVNPGSFLIDYSWNDIWQTPDAIVDAGAVGVLRYHSFDATKDLGGIGPLGSEAHRDNEIEMLASVGLGIIPGWEANQTGPLGGYNAGVRHGREFARQLKIAEVAEGSVVNVAFDFEIVSSQYGIAREYMRGINQEVQGYEMWAYGHDGIVTHLIEEEYTTGGWQTQAWSYGRISPYANLLQFARPPRLPDTDDNLARKQFKMWFPGGTVVPPDPVQGANIMANFIGAVAVSDGRAGVLIFGSDGNYYKYENHPGSIYYAFPRGQIGAAEYDQLPLWNAAEDAKWLGAHLGITPGGSTGKVVNGTFTGTIS